MVGKLEEHHRPIVSPMAYQLAHQHLLTQQQRALQTQARVLKELEHKNKDCNVDNNDDQRSRRTIKKSGESRSCRSLGSFFSHKKRHHHQQTNYGRENELMLHYSAVLSWSIPNNEKIKKKTQQAIISNNYHGRSTGARISGGNRVTIQRSYFRNRTRSQRSVATSTRSMASGLTTSSSNSAKLTKGCGMKASRVKRHDPGWLLSYHDVEHDSSSSGSPSGNVDRWTEKSTNSVSSLQTLCLKAVAKALPTYLKEWGRKETHFGLSWLSAPTLAALSALCSTSGSLTDNVAFVVGAHKHVKRLALHGSTDDNLSHREDDGSGGSSLTDKGILSLVSNHQGTDSCHRRLNAPSISIKDIAGTAVESSSLTSTNECKNNGENVEHHEEKCPVHHNLERLEIANAEVSLDTVAFLCKRSPFLTHLSLSNCTILQENPHDRKSALALLLLLDPQQGIVSLSNLIVLDLSHCDWINDSILFAFLQGRGGREGRKRSSPPLSLEYVNVAGCPGVSEFACLHLNQTLRGKPLISNEVRIL